MTRHPGWAAVAIGDELPVSLDEIDYQRVVMNPGATWDYFPAHYDPGYARENGHPTIFLNTMHVAGFVDRIVIEWSGPCCRVVRRKVSLLGSIYAGDTMVGRGRVTGKRTATSGGVARYLVDLEIDVYNQREELCCPAEVTVEFPRP